MGSKPEREDENPSARINWKLFLLVVGIIGIAFFAGMMIQSDGDSANSADVNSPDAIGQGIRPDSQSVAVETETRRTGKTSVPVEYYTDRSIEIKDFKINVLYLCEFAPTSTGFIILNKNRLSGLEFDFEGTHFSKFNTEFREDKVIVTADSKKYEDVPIAWQFYLLDSNKEIIREGSPNSPYSESEVDVWL